MFMDHPFSFLTGISLMTRAGFPARTTLSPKDLVTTAPAPATTLSPSVTPGRMVTPPPAQKLSPIVIGAPVLETRIALVWIQWVQGGQELAVRTNHGILSDRNGTYIQHGQIVIGIEIFS